jgi:ERCC4-type nuclease
LIILEDTRNKPEKNAHIRQQLEELGYKVERTKIYCGDYTFPTNQSICVDTKKDMNEIESNLIHDHERFKAECIRAKEAGIKLVILIQDPKLKVLGDVFSWFNVRSKWSKKAASGRQLAKMMYTMQERYGVKFEFCTKATVGKRIVELLGGE